MLTMITLVEYKRLGFIVEKIIEIIRLYYKPTYIPTWTTRLNF